MTSVLISHRGGIGEVVEVYIIIYIHVQVKGRFKSLVLILSERPCVCVCRKIMVMVVMVDSTKVMAVHRGHSQAIVMHRAHEGTREVMEKSGHVLGAYKGGHGGV